MRVGERLGRVLTVMVLLGLVAPSAAQTTSQPVIVKVNDDRPGTAACTDPFSLPIPVADLNNQPQAEVWLSVSEDGRLAAGAKDYRYSPIDDTTYNNRVWNGLYLSNDAGASWSNLAFDEASPNTGISGVTTDAYGLAPGQIVRLTQQSDPVVEFDRDGNVYTCALAFEPDPPDRPAGPSASAVVVSRWADGRLVQGTTHLLGLEADARLFDDKNWIAVDRGAPVDETIVVASWRLFTYTERPPVSEGGYIAVSADGAASFGLPIRLPIPVGDVTDSQFYQPLIGPDPATGRKTLYVMFTTASEADYALGMHLIKADLSGVSAGTAALTEHLQRPESWTYLSNRLTGQYGYGSDGWGGAFRFTSFFMPAVDRDTGNLYAVVHSFAPTSRRSRVLVTRSTDGGVGWSALRQVDDPGRGYQFMPTLAFRGGILSVLWYDSRNDPQFAPLSLIRGIDVYYAELDAQLVRRRVLRLTPETQRSDDPVFTRPRPVQALAGGRRGPHDVDLPPFVRHGYSAPLTQSLRSTQNCASERYGFIGDYIGLAADARFAYAAWCDLRDMLHDADVCAGHSCNGRRNQNIYFARIPKD